MISIASQKLKWKKKSKTPKNNQLHGAPSGKRCIRGKK